MYVIRTFILIAIATIGVSWIPLVSQSLDLGLVYTKDIEASPSITTSSFISSQWYGLEGRFFMQKKIVAAIGLKRKVGRHIIRTNTVMYPEEENNTDLDEWLETVFPSGARETPQILYGIPFAVAYSYGSKVFKVNTGVVLETQLYGSSFDFRSLGLRIEPNYIFKERYILSCSYNRMRNLGTAIVKYHSSFNFAIRYRFFNKQHETVTDI